MKGSSVYTFIFVMWILIILGGGISILILAPISISGYGEFDLILSSGIKAIVAFGLVVAWIFILTKIKNWIFETELKD
jgi:hypothetical protein